MLGFKSRAAVWSLFVRQGTPIIMLHTYARQNADHGPGEKEPGFAESFEVIFGIFRQQFWIIFLTAFLVIGIAGLYASITPPIYTASATMMIDRGTAQVRLGGVLTEVPVELESQVQLLKSQDVALDVASKLKFADDAELVGPPVGIRGLIHELRLSLLPSSVALDAEIDLTGLAASRALDRLKVTRTGYVFELEYWSLKPERAAHIANAFADAYIEAQLKYRDRAAQEASAWLKGQIRELRDQSRRADEAVAEFKAKNNIVSADGRLINDQQITLLNSQLVVAREKTAETHARLNRIEAVIRDNAPDREAIATVTDTLNNPIIVKLRTQYLDLSSREAMWSREYGTSHLAVVNLRRQIREVLASIHDELRRIAQTYKSEYEIAKQRQAELEKSVANAVAQYQETSQSLATLRDLESSAETYRGLHRNALQRATELVQKQSYPGAEARLITRAAIPAQPSSPSPLLVLCASAIGGVLLGFGLGALRASLDRVFRTAAQVEAVLQTKCLALPPAVKARSVKRAKRRGTPMQLESRSLERDASIFWDVVDEPLARFAEAMRSIRLEMQLGGSLGGPKKPITALGFTSSLPKEGKSTIAAAFALLVAQGGARTILVDCDLRNPALSNMLAPRAKNGLLEVMSGAKQLEEVVWSDPTTKLAFLPSIMDKSRAADSSGILSSSSLKAFFEMLRQSFDCVIVDFSPAAPIIDVQSTAGLVDAYVFVVEWSQTKIDVADLALRRATVVQENLLGAVLNKVDFKILGQYEGYRRDYFSDKHYGQYGQV